MKVEAACPSIWDHKRGTDEQRSLEEVLEDPRSLAISWETNRGHKSSTPGIYLIFHLPNTVKLGRILRQAHQQRGSNWNVKLKPQDTNPDLKVMLFCVPPAAWFKSWGERSLMQSLVYLEILDTFNGWILKQHPIFFFQTQPPCVLWSGISYYFCLSCVSPVLAWELNRVHNSQVGLFLWFILMDFKDSPPQHCG